VVVHTYFGVKHECLTGLVGFDIKHKSEGGRDNIRIACDAYGENLVKAILPGSGWIYYHDAINNVIAPGL